MVQLKRFGCLSLALTVCMIQTGYATPANASPALITASHGQAIYRNLLEHHWVPQTGLFASFPNSQDNRLAQQASTYEQGAMGLLALKLRDLERAQGILQFFRRVWTASPHGLMNFYNVDFGNAGIEKIVHVGPNAWVGLFAARYANQEHNADARILAQDIGYWIATCVPHKNGAVAMSTADTPHGAPWAHIFSTENNISYYAFLTELLKSDALDADQRRRFTAEHSDVENWLLNVALDRDTYKVRRGEIPAGIDSIAALDTVTWLVSAIGPRRLADRHVDIVRLLDVAAHEFEVSVNGQPGVDPTDQNEADLVFLQDHAPAPSAKRPAGDRHRMIWYEGLGQYLLALSAAERYLTQEGRLNEAAALAAKIRRLNEGFDAAAGSVTPGRPAAYPYATPGLFFRDGWRTPAPAAAGPAVSLIAGIWRLFAGLGVDPLSGDSKPSLAAVPLKVPHTLHLAARATRVYYGTSEEMTTAAWAHLNAGRWEAAIRQAEATITEWSTVALKLQERKERSGGLLPYSGAATERQAIFSYWALNDVAACYFILGKAWDEKRDYAQAGRALKQIVDHYALAQIWDPKGWFWSPADAVTSEFIERDPGHYGGLHAAPAAQARAFSS